MIQVTDPALIAEALRSRDIDKDPRNAGGLNAFASPHNIPMLLTASSNERWKAVRWVHSALCPECPKPSNRTPEPDIPMLLKGRPITLDGG